jgi:hypothetical protein
MVLETGKTWISHVKSVIKDVLGPPQKRPNICDSGHIRIRETAGIMFLDSPWAGPMLTADRKPRVAIVPVTMPGS